MNLYRIQTENVNRMWIEETVSKYFKGFTVYNVTGYWQGAREMSLVIEIMGDVAIYNVVRFLGKVIAQHNVQDTVLVSCRPCEGEFVNGH